MRNTIDPITSEIIQSSLQTTADEMFASMRRTAMSSIIYEVLDMGTAITDADGELASAGAGIPVFVGMLDKGVKQVRTQFAAVGQIGPGDIFLTNDPFQGGVTHLNDLILAMPIFSGNDLIAWAACIAHMTDIGGKVPEGLSTDATEIYQEGLVLPVIKLVDKGVPIQPIFEILKANSRMPDFLYGDLWAGIAAVRIGERRILELATKYGPEVFIQALHEYLDYGQLVSLNGLKKLPKGKFSLEEVQDSGVVFKAAIEIQDDAFIVDLRNNPDQDKGPNNLSRDGAVSAAQLVFKGITSSRAICNGGSFRPLQVLTRPGSVFEPRPPAAQGFYYEVAVRLYDLIWRTIAEQVPELLPAGHFASICGTMFGGIHPDTKRFYSVIEPQVGGWGGSALRDGNSAVFSGFHGETYNCPVEISEARNGVHVERLSLSDDSGGFGKQQGGKGICMEYRLRSDNCWLTFGYTRSQNPPWGLSCGHDGTLNYVEIIRGDGTRERLSAATGLQLNKGDVIRIITGNGAGWGDPLLRPAETVRNDLRNGYISEKVAKEIYHLDSRN